MDVPETRELSYFVAVAEELHFGRAARRLGMAQPPLSRAVARLERRMGVQLLERTSRSVQLTAAGRVFLAESRKALDAVSASVRRAQRAGRTDPKLTLVMKPNGDGGLLEPALRRYRRDPDAVDVEVVVCGIGEQAPMLRDGRADVAFLTAPYDDVAGFDTEALVTQDQVAVLPRAHRLAGRAALTLADLAGEPLPRWPGDDEHADDRLPPVRDTSQLMQLIALGQLVAVVPESMRRRAWPDVVCVPVLDAPPTAVLVAWPERTTSRAVAALVRACARAAETTEAAAGF
ncbi:LysR family transcriptional regulator [Streptomyces sp. TLI_171]|uniref:LysR family transcriptional regulator n=1 Tax=Streptomyces sp. TLI_171 TaxID=1938859 RepID=UPI000C194086|nr:LysR substrate-binding domain-containing protein [Streptomyces sp. TLI_171]RKE20793.1 LysR family transcriptional regulator [Streptomyces sp. TLI_171]